MLFLSTLCALETSVKANSSLGSVSISLQSREIDWSTTNLGTITFEPEPPPSPPVPNLPRTISRDTDSLPYQATFYPPSQHVIDHWEFSGGINVPDAGMPLPLINVYVTGPGSGTLIAVYKEMGESVTIDPNGGKIYVDQNPVTSQTVYTWSQGSTHELNPDSGYSPSGGTRLIFTQWDDGNTADPRTITVSGPATYLADWQTQYRLTIDVSPSGGGATNPLPGTYWYNEGYSQTVTENPNPSYTFDHWQFDEQNVGSDPSCLVTMNTHHTLIAVFAHTQWTIMVYMDADNDLEKDGIDDFLEMSSINLVEGVNVVVQMDRIPYYDDRYGDWTGCRRFLVTHGATPTPQQSIDDLGEVNMGDLNTLVDFVVWATTNYPANNYMLVLWDHGAGCLPPGGICFDWHENPHDPLSMDELGVAMTSIEASMGKSIEILGLDACLMSTVEVAYQVRGTIDIFVGSEELVPLDGWPYDDILGSLTSNPSMSPSDLASQIVESYVNSYQGGSQGTSNHVTMAAFQNSEVVSSVVSALDTFAQELSAHTSNYHTQITTARTNTENFDFQLPVDDRIYYDLYDFAQEIDQLVPEQTLHTATQNLINSIDTARIGQPGHGPYHPNSHGLSIYWPTRNQYSVSYEDLDMAVDTQWDEFLQTYYSFVSQLKVVAHSPVNLLLTDFYGHRVGYDPETESTVNEIPGATYSGPGSDPQEIIIPNPFLGTYSIDAFGTDSGSYTITIESIASNGSAIDNRTWTSTAVPDEQYTEGFELTTDGQLTKKDVAIIAVSTSRTIAGQSYFVSINITVENQGDFAEPFNVTLYANLTEIAIQTATLSIKNSTIITFTWNTTGWAKGNYTISAYITPIPGETDLSDNNSTDSWVFVTIPGDVDGDRDVDIYDVVKITGIYGSKRGDPQFNPNSDLDGDGEIKIYDVVICTSHYRQEW